MKKKSNKVVVVLASAIAILAVAGVAGTIGFYGNEQGWFTQVDPDFKDVKIESKSFEYDGSKKELEIIVPDGATYEVVIKNTNGEVVNECVNVGTYTYEVKVKVNDKTKDYTATLTIVESSDSELAGSNLHHIQMQKVSATEYKLIATIEPATATNQDLDWNIAFIDNSGWASGKTVTDYVTLTPSGKEATIRMAQRFSKQIKVTATTKDGTNLSASCTVDCRKIVNSVNVTFNADALDTSSAGSDKSIKYDESQRRMYITSNSLYENWISGISFTEVFTGQINYSEGTVDYSGSTDTTFTATWNSSYLSAENAKKVGNWLSSIDPDYIAMDRIEMDLAYTASEAKAMLDEYAPGATVGTYIPILDVTRNQCGQTYDFTFGILIDNTFVSNLTLDESNIIFE